MNLRSNFLAAAAGVLLGIFVGWCGAELFSSAAIDSGLATLVGSALGAAITVVGAMWVAQYQSANQSKAAERYVGAATAGVRDEANCMARMARTEGVASLELHAAKMVETIDLLRENVKLWQSGMPYSEINNFQARLLLGKLERKIIETSTQLGRDRDFLVGNVSQAVIDNAVAHLGFIGDEIQETCEAAMAGLSYADALPTEGEFVARVAAIQEDDRLRQRRVIAV